MLPAARSTAIQHANWHEGLTDIDEDAVSQSVVPNAHQAIRSAVEQSTNSATTSVNAQDPEAVTMPLFNNREQAGDLLSGIVLLLEPQEHRPAPVTFHALQEWEGYVTEIKETEFTARLTDLTSGANYASEEANIPLDEISEDDAAKMQVGSIFRWVIGYERRGGSKKRVSQIVLRDLPMITKSDLRDGREWAHSIVATFQQ